MKSISMNDMEATVKPFIEKYNESWQSYICDQT